MPRKKFALPEQPRAVVTGGGDGIGKAFAEALGARAGRVLVADIELEGAEAVAEQVNALGGVGIAVECDVADREQVARLATMAQELFGGIDIVVNNAGVAIAGLIGDITLEDWKWAVDIDLWGVIYGCHHFVPIMRAQDSGIIINVASAAGFASGPEMAPYCVSKAGVVSLSECLALELWGTGVSVTVLTPTFVKTNIVERMRATNPGAIELTKAIFERKMISAASVAKVTLAAAERGQLYVLPQMFARSLWWTKRFSPRFHQWMTHKIYSSRGVQKYRQLQE
jgi:NAD(P)-dependent dehydrogenase (short-subunit alcohol dehydrogenase family)